MPHAPMKMYQGTSARSVTTGQVTGYGRVRDARTMPQVTPFDVWSARTFAGSTAMMIARFRRSPNRHKSNSQLPTPNSQIDFTF